MEESVNQINVAITINVDMSVKNVMYLKMVMIGILLHVGVKMENICIMDNSSTRCDEVIGPYDQKTKTIPTNFNEKKSNL